MHKDRHRGFMCSMMTPITARVSSLYRVTGRRALTASWTILATISSLCVGLRRIRRLVMRRWGVSNVTYPVRITGCGSTSLPRLLMSVCIRASVEACLCSICVMLALVPHSRTGWLCYRAARCAILQLLVRTASWCVAQRYWVVRLYLNAAGCAEELSYYRALQLGPMRRLGRAVLL